MAASRLKKMFVNAPAGGYFFSVPGLAFARIVKVMRENVFYGVTSVISDPLLNNKVLFQSFGKFTFRSDNPFNPGERVFIIYKDPLI